MVRTRVVGRFGLFLLAMLLPLSPGVARAYLSEIGEPPKGQSPEWRLRTSTELINGATLLSSPSRVYLERVPRPDVVARANWCVYRISAMVKPGTGTYIARGQTICVSSLDPFGPCPGQTEFHFVDRKGHELGAAYAELVTAGCVSCQLEATSQYLIWKP